MISNLLNFPKPDNLNDSFSRFESICCKLKNAGQTITENYKLVYLLRSLPDSMGNIKDSFLRQPSVSILQLRAVLTVKFEEYKRKPKHSLPVSVNTTNATDICVE